MRRVLLPVVALLVLSLVAGPVALDRCLIRCDAVPQAHAATTGHCHATHPAGWKAANDCRHDHGTSSATGSFQVRRPPPLSFLRIPVASYSAAELGRRSFQSTAWSGPPFERSIGALVLPLRL